MSVCCFKVEYADGYVSIVMKVSVVLTSKMAICMQCAVTQLFYRTSVCYQLF